MELHFDEWQVRSYREDDIEAITKYANNRKIWLRLRNRFPHPYTLRDAVEWLHVVRAQARETNFAIASSTELIGAIGIMLQNDVYQHTAEIGFWLGEPFWNKGIATKAVQEFTKYSFTHFDLTKIYANVFENNPASMRVLEKAGYLFETRLKKHVLKDGKLFDQMIYSIFHKSVLK